jgi:hypothetical protein
MVWERLLPDGAFWCQPFSTGTDAGGLKRTPIPARLLVPVWEIERYEKDSEREMEEA